MKSIAFFFGLTALIACSAFSQNAVSFSGTSAAGRIAGSATFPAAGLPLTAIVGAPYSGEQTQEHIQTLIDGTHITRSMPAVKQYRDSQGRMRTERPFMMGSNVPESPVVIQISDPVAGVQFTLDTQNKVAHRTVVSQSRLLPPLPSGGGVGSQVNVAGGAQGTLGASAGVSGWAGTVTRPQVASEPLGTQVIEGVLTEGRRLTMTYPVGFQGNDRPIVVVTESWTSPELKLAILSRTTDPRSGESTTRMTNLSRMEPDPGLFQPPPDYTIVDETGPFSIQFSR